MNELKKLYMIIGTLVLAVALIIIVTMKGSKDQEELYNQFKTALAGEENTLVYIGSSNCGYCSLLSPSLEDMASRYEFDYIYFDMSEVNSSYTTKLMEDLNLSEIKTPYLAVVSNNKVVNYQKGYADYDITFKFLQDNGIIKDDAKLSLNYIGLEEYKKLLANDEPSVIVVGQSTCIYCVHAKIILNDIAEEKGVTINYLNISYLNEEEGAEFESSLDYFEEDWGTPIMFIGKKGKMVDLIDQLATKEEYIEFLIENGVISEKGE